jgi:hypothetical protein
LAADRPLWDRLSDDTKIAILGVRSQGNNALDVSSDDPGQDVSLDDHTTDDLAAQDLLARVSDHTDTDTIPPALADGGSNCGLAGSKIRVRHEHENGRIMDIEAIVRYRMCRIPLGTAGAPIDTDKTVYSVGHIETFHHHGMYGKSMRDGRQPSIHTVTSEADWYPTTMDRDEWDNLPHISLTSEADWYPASLDQDEWDNLHHISLASESDWVPTTLDREHDDDDKWFDALTKEMGHVPVLKVNLVHVNAARTVRQTR